jgi:translation initiation factor 2 beta subunit (eIF-2beta)/eIF-5
MTNNNNSNLIKLNSIDSFKIINPNLENDNNLYDDTLVFTEDIGLNIDNKINILVSPDLVYTTLLDEIYDTISDNSQLFGNKKNLIDKPDIKYENRKTFWYNYGKNCSQINRSMDQLKRFIEKEMAVETSINDKSNLILRGKYNFAMIASTYKKYIINYVKCSTCKSIETEIIRNSSNRLDYIKCLNPKCNTCKVVIKI